MGSDGGKVVSPRHRPRYSPETLFSCFWYSFLLEAESTPGPSVAGRIPDEVIGFFFSIYLILPAALGSEVDSVSNRNEHQESSWGVNRGRRM
jgi:hypothetical protein